MDRHVHVIRTLGQAPLCSLYLQRHMSALSRRSTSTLVEHTTVLWVLTANGTLLTHLFWDVPVTEVADELPCPASAPSPINRQVDRFQTTWTASFQKPSEYGH